MAFWGVEVKPGKPFRQIPSAGVGSQLHLSQATLGLNPKKDERTVVKVRVGKEPEILLCSLTGGHVESCGLDLIFSEDAVFSVTGSTSVHLTGYYMPTEIEDEDDDEYDMDGMGEEFGSEDDEEGEEESEDDEDEDEESEDEEELPLASSRGVIIEELTEEEEQTVKALPAASDKPIVTENEGAEEEEDEEDEDGFVKKPAKKKQAVAGKTDDKPVSASQPQAAAANGKETKKQAKARKAAEAAAAAAAAKPEAKTPVKAEAAAQKKPAEKAAATPGAVAKGEKKGADAAKKEEKKGADTPEKKEIKAGKGGKGTRREFPNGMVIEEVAMGKPDGKKADNGKRVSVKYVGRLKSNNKIFDSSTKPFKFVLGAGEVIKGWDVGVAGMRVGDKRRLTLPPSMGYGARGAPPDIPGNATLVFDVELVNVH